MAPDRRAQAGPIATPLPEPPSAAFWSATQWDVLVSLMEAVFPPIVSPHDTKVPLDGDEGRSLDIPEDRRAASFQLLGGHGPTRDEFDAFLEHSPARTAEFLEGLVRTSAALSVTQRRPLGFLLFLLSWVGRFSSILSLVFCLSHHRQSSR